MYSYWNFECKVIVFKKIFKRYLTNAAKYPAQAYQCHSKKLVKCIIFYQYKYKIKAIRSFSISWSFVSVNHCLLFSVVHFRSLAPVEWQARYRIGGRTWKCPENRWEMSRSIWFLWAWQVKNAQKWFRQQGPTERATPSHQSVSQSVKRGWKRGR